MGAMLVAIVASYVLLLRSTCHTTPANSTWRLQWQQLLAAEGIRETIPLLVHRRLGPMLCRLPNGYAVVIPESTWADFSSRDSQNFVGLKWREFVGSAPSMEF